MQNKTTRHHFTGAIALMALILTITAIVAHQKVVTDAYGADYLILNPERD